MLPWPFTCLEDLPLLNPKHLISIHGGNFLVTNFCDNGGAEKRMMLYEGDENAWLPVKLKSEFRKAEIACCVYHPGRNQLLCSVRFDLNDVRHLLVTIDLDSLKDPVYTPKLVLLFQYECMVLVGDILHLFGFDLPSMNATVDTNTWTLQEHPVPANVTLDHALYLKDSNNILVMAARARNDTDDWMSTKRNLLYEYSVKDKAFTLQAKQEPDSVTSFHEMVCTMDSRYIILVGYRSKGSVKTKILVYDRKLNVMSRSKLNCPSFGYPRIILTANRSKDDLLVFGFVRTSFKEHALRNVQSFPHYLIEMMAKWISREFVHFIQEEGHWRVNVDAALQLSNIPDDFNVYRKYIWHFISEWDLIEAGTVCGQVDNL